MNPYYLILVGPLLTVTNTVPRIIVIALTNGSAGRRLRSFCMICTYSDEIDEITCFDKENIDAKIEQHFNYSILSILFNNILYIYIYCIYYILYTRRVQTRVISEYLRIIHITCIQDLYSKHEYYKYHETVYEMRNENYTRWRDMCRVYIAMMAAYRTDVIPPPPHQ